MSVNKICRCCLRSCKNPFPIYDSKEKISSACIFECIQDICDVKISPDDNLPESICHQCFEILKKSYLFRLEVKKNYLFLINILKEDDSTIDESNNSIIDETPKAEDLNILQQPNEIDIDLENNLHEYHVDHNDLILENEDDSFQDENEINDNMADHSHENDNTNTQTFHCECGKSFKYLRNLQYHHKKHFEGPLKCPQCTQTFHKNYDLKRHINSQHTTVKPFQCEICAKRFCSKTDVNRHLKYHRSEKNHKCTQCGQAFYENASLQVHIKSVHLKEKKFSCSRCNKSFATVFKVRRHQKSKSCFQSTVVSTISVDDQLIIVDYNNCVVLCNNDTKIENLTEIISDPVGEFLND